MGKNSVIGYVELIYCGDVVAVQSMTTKGESVKAVIVERWRKHYGPKFYQCQIKTTLFKEPGKSNEEKPASYNL